MGYGAKHLTKYGRKLPSWHDASNVEEGQIRKSNRSLELRLNGRSRMGSRLWMMFLDERAPVGMVHANGPSAE
jgi:hypothetical protein